MNHLIHVISGALLIIFMIFFMIFIIKFLVELLIDLVINTINFIINIFDDNDTDDNSTLESDNKPTDDRPAIKNDIKDKYEAPLIHKTFFPIDMGLKEIAESMGKSLKTVNFDNSPIGEYGHIIKNNINNRGIQTRLVIDVAIRNKISTICSYTPLYPKNGYK